MTDPEIIVPAKFQTIIRDFTKDLTTTFPEYSILWKKWTAEDISPKDVERLFKYCTEVYPERFFDILYQNDDMFKEESDVNTRFLPAVEFRLLYNCAGVTETTRSAIWKYLQLILMTVLNSVRDKAAFGEAADIFEGVDENVLQDKLNKTLEEIGSFFHNLGEEHADDAHVPNFTNSGQESMPDMNHFKEFFENIPKHSAPQKDASSDQNEGDSMPNANDLHEHLKGLFEGKIGSLAKELAEEISHDVEHLFADENGAGINPADPKSAGDLINQIIKNPKKIMTLMKTISGKLQQKMKSGEISEEEIMKEAGDLMGKMKGMKGMGPMNDMFKNLAKGMGGKGGINISALQRMQKQMATKERMRTKMEEKAAAKNIERSASDPTRAVFRLGEEDAKPQYSAVSEKPSASASTSASTSASASVPLKDEELIAMFSDNKSKTSVPEKKKSKSKSKK